MVMQFERKRYIESFDSVRFELPKDADERRKHAEIELMLSLLFGERLVVPEPYSFDSLGFLDIATELLDKRPQLRKRTPIWNPFILALRKNLPGHDSYRGMIAALLRDPDFVISSGWSDTTEITNDMDIRNKFAQYIVEGDYREAKRHFDPVKIEQLEMLDGYFSEVNPCEAHIASMSLKDYIGRLVGVNEADVPREFRDYVVALKKASGVLIKEIEDLSKRSIIRTKGQVLLPANIYDGIVEYVDSCYNRIVANSVGATTRVFSTKGSRRSEEDIYIRVAEKLGQWISSEQFSPDRLSLDIAIREIGEDECIQKEYVKLPQVNWNEIWEIVTDDDWLLSIAELQNATPAEVQDAFDSHINLLAKKLVQPWEIKVTDQIIGGGLGASIGAASGCIISYLWNLAVPLTTTVVVALTATMGYELRSLLTEVTSRVRKWHVEGSIRGSLQNIERQNYVPWEE